MKPPTLPALIEEMLTFRDILQEKSQNKDIILLESFALALMNDVIGPVLSISYPNDSSLDSSTNCIRPRAPGESSR